MVAIKLYQPEEIVLNYFKTWGYTSPETLSYMTDSFLEQYKDSLSMDEILGRLNETASNVSEQIMGHPTLPKEQQLAYFKMIFLSENLAQTFKIFMPLTKDELKQMTEIYHNHSMQVAPQLVKSVMIPQKIKIYKPLLPIKKALIDFARKVKKYVRK